MYEKPNLICVGEAQEVILGLVDLGPDLDHTWMDGQDEFAFDADPARA
jgi:hypothetical protein